MTSKNTKILLSVIIISSLLIYRCSDSTSGNDKTAPELSWQEINGFENQRIFSINIDVSGIIYVVTDQSSISFSKDNGNSWEAASDTTYNGYIRGLAFNNSGDIFIFNNGGVYKTRDIEGHWQKILDVGEKMIHLVLADGNNLYTITSSDLYMSQDNGLTWENKGPLPTTGYSYYRSITRTPKDKIILGTNGFGVYSLSEDHNSWEGINDLIETYIESFTTDLKDNIFAVGNYQGPVYRSDDKGDSWQQVSIISSDTFKLISNKNNNLFAATYDKGVLRSTDRAESWQSVSDGLPEMLIFSIAIDQSGYIYTGDGNSVEPKGLFRTTISSAY